MHLFYPRVRVFHPDLLPQDRPYILVCNSLHPIRSALLLAAYASAPIRFIKEYPQTPSPLKKLLLKILHIVPLSTHFQSPDKMQQMANLWKDSRDVLTDGYPLVFFSDCNGENAKISKGAAKLAFHTESVFDFHLRVEIIPLSIRQTEQKELHLCFSAGIPVSLYEKEYKQYPARTIRQMTHHLEESLSLNMASRPALTKPTRKELVTQA